MAILNQSTLNHKIIRTGTEETIGLITNSNYSRVNKLGKDVLCEKTFDKNWVNAGEVVDVTTTITNNSDVDITNFTFLDTLSNDLSFVDGSLFIGGQNYPTYNIQQGFSHNITLGGSGASFVLKYKLQVATHTSSDTVEDTTKTTFYVGEKIYDVTSNKVAAYILDNQIFVLKSANKQFVKSGDNITYKITISNEGTITNTNLFFVDPIPTGTVFVENSVTVNGETKESFNPSSGFVLDDITPSEKIIITFQVLVE